MRRIAKVGLFLLLLPCISAAQGQGTYPERAVRFVIGLPPGGGADFAARVVAQALSESWGKPVVPENVTGASGSVAAAQVARAPGDGYTLFFSGDAAMTTNVTLYDALAYEPLKDFAPITLAATSSNVLLVHPSVNARSVQELIALAKAQPGKLAYASAGSGTSQDLAGELLKQRAGIDILHVPYKGGGPAMQDVLAGRVQFTFANIVAALPQMREGKLRGLAVSSLKRWPAAGELPTIAESGFPEFEAVAWFGLLAPAATPQAVVRKIHADTIAALARPEVATRLTSAGLEIVANTPAQFREQIREEIGRKGALVRASGAKAN
jgi:tripartite-type tricarboxylate transporter receptor subunit TctC